MKPWMRILMWFGLGTALGYCAGKQVGYTKAKREDEGLVNNAYERGKSDLFKDTMQEFNDIASQYRIENPDIQQPVVYERHELTKEDVKDIENWPPEDDAEMPMEEPAIDDLDNLDASDIPQFHPTFVIPRVVSEEEYDKCGDLDEKTLIYYEGDEVLYCCEDRRPIGEDEQPALIGIGTLEAFRAGPGAPKDELYVINETYGRFKIIRMDDAFADAVDGTCAPDDEDDDDV